MYKEREVTYGNIDPNPKFYLLQMQVCLSLTRIEMRQLENNHCTGSVLIAYDRLDFMA
jgi:hypothetical protein